MSREEAGAALEDRKTPLGPRGGWTGKGRLEAGRPGGGWVRTRMSWFQGCGDGEYSGGGHGTICRPSEEGLGERGPPWGPQGR